MNVQSTPTSRPASPDNTSAAKKRKCGDPQATLLFGERVNKQLPEPDISEESAHHSYGAPSKIVEKTAVVEPSASLQASKSPPLSEQRSQQARAFYRSCHPLDPVPNPEKPVACDYPAMRSWLQDFSQEGKDAVVQLDNMVANGEPHIQEELFLATARVMGRAQVLDVTRADTIRHADHITSAWISPNGHHLLTAALDTYVVLSERVDGQWQRRQHIHHESQVASACFSPCSRFFFTGSADHSARIYQRIGEQWQLQTVIQHSDHVENVCCSADSQRIATALGFNKILIHEQHNGLFQHQATIETHTNIRSVSFTADSNHLLIQAAAGESQLWCCIDNQRWEQQKPIHSLERMYNCTISPDGQHLIAFAKANQGSATICRLIDGQWQEQQSFESWDKPHFSADGTTFVGIDNDAKRAKIWQYRNEKWEQIAALPHHACLDKAHLSLDGKRLLTICDATCCTLWQSSDNRGWSHGLTIMLTCEAELSDSGFSPDGSHCFIAIENTLFILGDFDGRVVRKANIEHTCVIDSACFSPNGDSILLVGDNYRASVLQLKSKEDVGDHSSNIIKLSSRIRERFDHLMPQPR